MRLRSLSIALFLLVVSLPLLAADTSKRGGATVTIGADDLEVLSWSFGVTQTVAVGGGGAGTGKAQFQDFHFVTRVSKSSASLFRACATGQHIPEVKLVARDAKGQSYYVVTLKDVLVTSFQSGGTNADDLPTDQISLSYASVELQVLGL